MKSKLVRKTCVFGWRKVKKAYKIFHKKLDLKDRLVEKRVKLTDLKVQFSDDEIRAVLKRKLAVSRFVMKMACLFSGSKSRTARTTIFAKGITVEKFSQELD